MDQYTKLAKETIENYVKDKKVIKVPKGLPKEMTEKQAGVFVSLKKKGELRGCIGTFLPTQKNIAAEIINNAISAATQDLRFCPVEESELKDLEYSVDVLNKPEPIKSLKELDPKKYGIIVENKFGYRGLLLPNLEGVNDVETQLAIACDKAGIHYKKEPLYIERFTVERHK